MENLTPNFKISTAKDLTSLAIENNLITQHSDPKDTAKEVCDFFKFIVDNLDNNLLDSKE